MAEVRMHFSSKFVKFELNLCKLWISTGSIYESQFENCPFVLERLVNNFPIASDFYCLGKKLFKLEVCLAPIYFWKHN